MGTTGGTAGQRSRVAFTVGVCARPSGRMTILSALGASLLRKPPVGAGPELSSPHLAGLSHLSFLATPGRTVTPQLPLST